MVVKLSLEGKKFLNVLGHGVVAGTSYPLPRMMRPWLPSEFNGSACAEWA
jgi:hypothetical protein